MSRTSASTQVAGAPVAAVRRRGELEHPRAEVDADDLVGAEVPQRQRVAAAGALEVDRPAAAPAQVADEVVLDRAAGSSRRARISSTASSNQPSYRSAASSQAARFAACIAADVRGLLGVAGRTCGFDGLVVHGPASLRAAGHTKAAIHRTTAHRDQSGGRAQNRPLFSRRSGLVARTAELSRRGCRSRGSPRGGWSPRSRLRAMRLRSQASGGHPASAVASRALGPFASSFSGTSGRPPRGEGMTPRLSPRWQRHDKRRVALRVAYRSPSRSVLAFRPPASSRALTVSPRVPAEPARFGVIVAVQVAARGLGHRDRPRRDARLADDDDRRRRQRLGVLRAVSVKAWPRTAPATEVSRRNASASTEVDWAARWVAVRRRHDDPVVCRASRRRRRRPCRSRSSAAARPAAP